MASRQCGEDDGNACGKPPEVRRHRRPTHDESLPPESLKQAALQPASAKRRSTLTTVVSRCARPAGSVSRIACRTSDRSAGKQGQGRSRAARRRGAPNFCHRNRTVLSRRAVVYLVLLTQAGPTWFVPAGTCTQCPAGIFFARLAATRSGHRKTRQRGAQKCDPAPVRGGRWTETAGQAELPCCPVLLRRPSSTIALWGTIARLTRSNIASVTCCPDSPPSKEGALRQAPPEPNPTGPLAFQADYRSAANTHQPPRRRAARDEPPLRRSEPRQRYSPRSNLQVSSDWLR